MRVIFYVKILWLFLKHKPIFMIESISKRATTMYKDGHHIVSNRLEWSLRPDARKIRETPSLIPRIERPLHEQIHRETPAVPLLGHLALQRTLANFKPTRNTLESMERLMKAIEISTQSPKCHDIEKNLADLAIWAIDLQRPYLQDIDQSDSITYIDLGGSAA